MRPRNELEVIQVLRASHRHDVPVTARGGGTANYAQCMPIHGGAVLDLGDLDQMQWIRPGSFRAQAGIRLGAIETALNAAGQELRIFPSTLATATLGGFIAGGSGGIGSITWGMLREPGNILGARLITAEAEPRVLELRGNEIGHFAHAYGTTGILTEIEMPAAPAQAWVDAALSFDDFKTAAAFGRTFAGQAAVVKKLCSVLAPPIPQNYLKPLKSWIKPGETIVLTMVAEQSWEAFAQLVAEAGGRVAYRMSASELEEKKRLPLFMMSWNHTTLLALGADRSLTYLQTAYPQEQMLEKIESLSNHFGDELMQHLEFFRSGAGVGCAGIQLLRFTTEERLEEIMAYHEAQGCRQFNPHAYTVEDGGMKTIDLKQVAYKRISDPKGLLNPGKMRGWS
ncbi:MAG: FAD-binding oxidoreductase [Gammaproteobacteria bacterium]